MTTEMLTRANARTSSVDLEARTVDVIFASETPVRRRAYDGEFDEVLVVSKDAIDRSRLDDGMSLLDSHRANSVESILGSVVPTSFRIEGGKAVATIKFSRKQAAEEILQDIADGHRLPISVGYKIIREERTEGERGAIPIIRATRWMPLEVSLVAVPADSTAHTRQEPEMTEETTIDRQDTNRKLRKAERVELIRGLAAIASLDDEEAAELIEESRGMSDIEIRAALLEKIVERQEQTPAFPHLATRGMGGGGETLRQAREDAIYARLSGTAPTDRAREFMNDRLQDHAAGLLEANGVSTRGMSREEIFGFRNHGAMHTTSDFPLILGNVSNRIMLAAFEQAQSPIKTVLARRTSHNDFRPSTRLRLGDLGLLKKVNEAGEIKSTTRSETTQGYAIETYGLMMAVSRQMLINDDLNAFGDWSRAAGRTAAETENELLFQMLTSNAGNGPKIGETGHALFHASHGNLAPAGAALSVDSLSTARKAMRQQKGLPGGSESRKSFINATPKYLLVGPELETEAEKVLSAIYAANVADANPLAGKLTLLVEPRIEDYSWYVFADPASLPVVEFAYLTGAEGPQVAQQDGWNVLGTEYRVVLDFGCDVVDFRGSYRNPGAAPTP